jgi:NADP-reducing hydrogenase subunit HndB
MKSLAELSALRDKMRNEIDLRNTSEKDDKVRIVVGMATCGIAAGARPVLNSFVEEAAKRGLKNVTVTQTGCIGVCRLEPIVEVQAPNAEKVTYVKVTPEMVSKIIADHIVNNKVVQEYTIGMAE